MIINHCIISRFELEELNGKFFLWECFRMFLFDTLKPHYYSNKINVHDDLVMMWKSDYDQLIKEIK